jgi:ankyrin repeat protein
VEHPDEEMVEIFIEYGLTSYDMSKFSQSPYDIAIQKNKYEAVELFNRLKNDKDYQSRLKRNPLTLAIVMNEFDKADSLIDIVNVNDKDIFGNTPLFYAIMNREYFLVERLLQKDASIYNIDFSKDDAIYYATVVGDENIVRLIQTKKVDYTKKYGEYTVLEYAKHNRLKKVLEQLKKGMI